MLGSSSTKSSSSGWFPFHYRDVKSWHSDLSLPLSTPSDVAAKYFDAAVAQMVLMDEDAQVGGAEKAMEKAMEADPEFVLGKAVLCGLETHGCNILKSPDTVKKIYELKEASKSKVISDWERSHLDATVALAEDDTLTACRIWEDILVDHPKDALALHFLFFGNLHASRRRFLRDSVHRVIEHYEPGDRYYGNVHGKLCFGFQENGQYDLATKEGDIALAHSPKDAWASHSVAHIYEETNRPREGISFLERTEGDWSPNGLSVHIWWHKTLYHLNLGEREEALSLFDGTIGPRAIKSNTMFPLSDAASLLLRLELDGGKDNSNNSLKPRWRELGETYKEHCDKSSNNVFYDFHALVATLFGGQRDAAERLRDNVREQAGLGEDRKGNKSWNCEVARRAGLALADATVAFAERDYEGAVRMLNPVRFECQELLGGSHAQKDVIDLLLLRASILAGRTGLARQLLAERVARCSRPLPPVSPDGDRLLIHRLKESLTG